MTEADGRRARNRERLYAAALALFAEQGYAATTMEDVAVRAGMSRRSAFNHFPAKSDLTVEWAARRRARAASGDPGASDGALGRVRAWFRALAEVSAAEPVETEQFMRGWLEAQGPIRHRTGTADALVPLLERARRDGSVGAHVDPTRAAEMLTDLYYGVLWRWLSTAAAERGSPVGEMDAVLDLALRGLAPAPPRR